MRTIAQRFEDKYQPIPECGCWIWTGALDRNGYARMEVTRDERVLVHRLSWLLNKGPLTKEQCVLHRCDVRCCVNPGHLFLGTKGINNADRCQKGRNADRRGAKNTQSKLTDEQVREIKESPLGAKRLSRLYPVSDRTIRKIKAGSRWGHV